MSRREGAGTSIGAGVLPAIRGEPRVEKRVHRREEADTEVELVPALGDELGS